MDPKNRKCSLDLTLTEGDPTGRATPEVERVLVGEVVTDRALVTGDRRAVLAGLVAAAGMTLLTTLAALVVLVSVLAVPILAALLLSMSAVAAPAVGLACRVRRVRRDRPSPPRS